MTDLILTTFNWVPEMPRGYVRDLRVRWALEEAGLPYRVESVPFDARGAEHFAHQPFGQVPWLTDGGISIFESGAILLHLGLRSEALMPTDPRGRSKAMEWLFAALKATLIKYRHRHDAWKGRRLRRVAPGRLAVLPSRAAQPAALPDITPSPDFGKRGPALSVRIPSVRRLDSRPGCLHRRPYGLRTDRAGDDDDT